MIKLSSEAKDRLSVVINVGKTVFHWGFVPTVLYLGERGDLQWGCHFLSTWARFHHVNIFWNIFVKD